MFLLNVVFKDVSLCIYSTDIWLHIMVDFTTLIRHTTNIYWIRKQNIGNRLFKVGMLKSEIIGLHEYQWSQCLALDSQMWLLMGSQKTENIYENIMITKSWQNPSLMNLFRVYVIDFYQFIWYPFKWKYFFLSKLTRLEHNYK